MSWDDSGVVIGLPASTAFAMKMVDTPQNVQIVTELVRTGRASGINGLPVSRDSLTMGR